MDVFRLDLCGQHIGFEARHQNRIPDAGKGRRSSLHPSPDPNNFFKSGTLEKTSRDEPHGMRQRTLLFLFRFVLLDVVILVVLRSLQRLTAAH